MSGRLADRYGYTAISTIGAVGTTLCLVGTSFLVDDLKQGSSLVPLYFVHGFVYALCSSLIFVPGLTVLALHFSGRLGAATGVATAGAGLGGLVLAPCTQLLLDSVGLAGAFRVLAVVCAVLHGGAAVLMAEPVAKGQALPAAVQSGGADVGAAMLDGNELQTSKANQKEGERAGQEHSNAAASGHEDAAAGDAQAKHNEAGQAVKAFSGFALLRTDRVYLMMFLSTVCWGFGYYTPFFYFSAQAVSYGHSPAFGSLLIASCNGASMLGRFAVGVAGDKVGFIACLLICMLGATASLGAWALARTQEALLAVAICFGFSVGGFISLYSPFCSAVFGNDHIASRVGFLYSGLVLGYLLGPPIAGAILASSSYPNSPSPPNYTPMIMYAAASFSGATVFTGLAALLHRRSKHHASEVG